MWSGQPAVTMIFNNSILDIIVCFLKVCKDLYGLEQYKHLFIFIVSKRLFFIYGLLLRAWFLLHSKSAQAELNRLVLCQKTVVLACEDVKQWFF